MGQEDRDARATAGGSHVVKDGGPDTHQTRVAGTKVAGDRGGASKRGGRVKRCEVGGAVRPSPASATTKGCEGDSAAFRRKNEGSTGSSG